MDKLTSYVHLLHLLETDVRYKWLVIYGYKSGQLRGLGKPAEKVSFKEAMKWVDDWIDSEVNIAKRQNNCHLIIWHLNFYRHYAMTKANEEPLP